MTWLQDKVEEERRSAVTAEGTAGEVGTPIAPVPQDLPVTQIGVDIPPSPLQVSDSPPSTSRDSGCPSGTFVNIPPSAASSPTLSISTLSDLTPTELGEDVEGSSGKLMMTARHETFYFEDGNVEIACGHTVFRVHSTTISFSSPKLRDLLSKSALLRAPMPEGCPRIAFTDTAEDFAILLKMIYTPGYVTPPADAVFRGPIVDRGPGSQRGARFQSSRHSHRSFG